MSTTFRSPLHEMAATTPTDFWNDSCAVGELRYALEHGAVGATSNPTIVASVLRTEFDDWKERVGELFRSERLVDRLAQVELHADGCARRVGILVNVNKVARDILKLVIVPAIRDAR